MSGENQPQVLGSMSGGNPFVLTGQDLRIILIGKQWSQLLLRAASKK